MTAVAMTRGRWRTIEEKRPAFVDWRAGIGVYDGGTFQFIPHANLGDFCDGMPDDIERVFVVGARIGDTPDGLREWMTSEGGDWTPSAAGHYLEGPAPILRFDGPPGRRLVIQRAASWFGEEPYTPAETLAAWSTLRAALADRFDGATLLGTPGTTGRELFIRSLGDRTFPLASAEHQTLIRATSGQGRDELLPAPVVYDVAYNGSRPGDSPAYGPGMAGLAEYDGRLMYGALAWGLGSGVEADEEARGPAELAAFAADFARNPQRRGRYLVRWRVPSDWRHVGLVGVWTGARWEYPSTPGETGTSWVDGSELALLAWNAWPFAIDRRLLLHEPKGPGPLDRWAKKLAALRLGLVEQSNYLALSGADDAECRAYTLAAAGARAMLLHALGAFMGTSHTVTRWTPLAEAETVPDNAINPRVMGEGVEWGEPRPTAWPELSHPEWPAAIYGRCRARLLSGPGGVGALNVPAHTVVAFRTDALYLTERTGWVDDGKPGRLRLVRWVPGPLPWPASKAELLRMRAGG